MGLIKKKSTILCMHCPKFIKKTKLNTRKDNKTYTDITFITWSLPETHAGHQQSWRLSCLSCQHPDFATELMEWLLALIDCCPPCGHMPKGMQHPIVADGSRQSSDIPWYSRQWHSQIPDTGNKISAQICSWATWLKKGACQCSSDTSITTHKLGVFSH